MYRKKQDMNKNESLKIHIRVYALRYTVLIYGKKARNQNRRTKRCMRSGVGKTVIFFEIRRAKYIDRRQSFD